MGNVVEDRAPDGGWAPGGPSLYSARMALALGAGVTLVTRVSATYDRRVLEGLKLAATPAGECPRYENSYDESGERVQLLRNEGETLDLALLAGLSADALIVAPAFHECAGLPEISAEVVGVSLQGPLRSVDREGRVGPHVDPRGQVVPFVRPGVFGFFSEEDTTDAVALARWLSSRGATALLTRGYRGATLFAAEEERHLEAVEARMVDPTGAGDCFATAFVVRMAETGKMDEACRYALAAGALAVEGVGIAGIPTRGQVEARLGEVAA